MSWLRGENLRISILGPILGTVLRNTEWAYGVVIFAGKDTKLMQNSGKTKFKRTSIDRLLNFIILGVSIVGMSEEEGTVSQKRGQLLI